MESSLNKYNLHDSLVNDIKCDDIEQKITINIELANWAQSDYNENQPEMIDGVIEFYGISNFQHEPHNMSFDGDEILSIKVLEDNISYDKKIEIVLLGVCDVKIINFNAKYVEIKFT